MYLSKKESEQEGEQDRRCDCGPWTSEVPHARPPLPPAPHSTPSMAPLASPSSPPLLALPPTSISKFCCFQLRNASVIQPPLFPASHLTQLFNQMLPSQGPPLTALLTTHPPSSLALPSSLLFLFLASRASVTIQRTHILFTVCPPLKEHRPHGQGVSPVPTGRLAASPSKQRAHRSRFEDAPSACVAPSRLPSEATPMFQHRVLRETAPTPRSRSAPSSALPACCTSLCSREPCGITEIMYHRRLTSLYPPRMQTQRRQGAGPPWFPRT